MRARPEIERAKQQLRAGLRERLRLLGPLGESEARKLQERLLASGILDGPGCVALYCALPSEVPCAFLEETLRARGVRVCLPRLPPLASGARESASPGDRAARDPSAAAQTVGTPRILETRAPEALEFRAAGHALERSPLGFAQPPEESERISLEQIDAFVIPLRGADLQGNRLGRGRGHYDVTLAAHPRAKRIGLLREAQVVDAVPAGEHDQRLDALCTEARFLLCPPRAKAAAL